MSQSNSNQSKKMITIGALLLMIGFLSGWLGFLLFGDIAGSCKVLFVSGDAIIRLEEERIKEKLPGQKLLFFGKKDEALEKIETIAGNLASKRTKVVFISNNSGRVLGRQGISELVHRELIKELEEK